MNVCLDMSLLGVPTEWVSVLPTNQWGRSMYPLPLVLAGLAASLAASLP
eukprot:COSAG01_NODE_1447_length_10278_cov_47.625209_10_plen_49_part_00